MNVLYPFFDPFSIPKLIDNIYVTIIIKENKQPFSEGKFKRERNSFVLFDAKSSRVIRRHDSFERVYR